MLSMNGALRIILRQNSVEAVNPLLDAWPFWRYTGGLGMHVPAAESPQPENCWLLLWDCICVHLSLR